MNISYGRCIVLLVKKPYSILITNNFKFSMLLISNPLINKYLVDGCGKQRSNRYSFLVIRFLNIALGICLWKGCFIDTLSYITLNDLISNGMDGLQRLSTYSIGGRCNRLPTCDSLARRNVPLQSTLCKLCGEYDETVNHIFTSCRLAMEMWSEVGSWCKIQPVFAFNFKDLMDIPHVLRGDENFKKAVHAVFMVTTWAIWKHRNAIFFEGQAPSSKRVLCEIKVTTSLWLNVRSRYRGALVLNNFPYDPD